ncbi:MAG: hypothetical protein ACE5DM_01760 [Candidatus Nanoarchaeia archaeon]
MKKRYFPQIVVALLLCVILVPAVFGAVSFYLLDRTNFPSGISRVHIHNFTFTGNLTIVKPDGFNWSGYTGNATISGNNITWLWNDSSTTVWLNLTSPSSCSEGSRYFSYIYNDGSLIDYFTYVCIPDNKVLDYKVEYGHGDNNYLTDLYISNDTMTLFNLLRVWNIGQYLDPDADASNVSMRCTFENLTVRTHGHGEVTYNSSEILMDFTWSLISGGYWFRLGVLSQDFTGKPLGDTYNVTCSELVYSFGHQEVRVPGLNYSIEIRSCNALNIDVQNITSSVARVDIKNLEKYMLMDLYFERILYSVSTEEHIIQLFPNETLTFYADSNSTSDIVFYFIPSWYQNSLNPQYCIQTESVTASSSTTEGNLTVEITSPSSGASSCSGTAVTISANVTNRSAAIDTVRANVTDPGGSSSILNMSDADNDGIYTVSYTGSSIGTYSVQIIANGTGVLVNDSVMTTFVMADCATKTGGGGGLRRTYICNNNKDDDDDGLIDYPDDPGCSSNRDDDEFNGCEEKWNCGQWGPCINMQRMRVCDELSSCGTIAERPAIKKFDDCSPPKPLSRPPPTPEEPGIEVELVERPEEVDACMRSIQITAQVTNKFGEDLYNVLVTTDVPEQFKKYWSDDVLINRIPAHKAANVTFTMEQFWCVDDTPKVGRANISDVPVTIYATTGRNDAYASDVIPFKLEMFSVVSQYAQYDEGEEMKLCFFYNNLNRLDREKLEIELMVDEQRHTYIEDFLASYMAPANMVLAVSEKYALKNVPKTADYMVLGKLYERGSLFQPRYLISEGLCDVRIIKAMFVMEFPGKVCMVTPSFLWFILFFSLFVILAFLSCRFRCWIFNNLHRAFALLFLILSIFALIFYLMYCRSFVVLLLALIFFLYPLFYLLECRRPPCRTCRTPKKRPRKHEKPEKRSVLHELAHVHEGWHKERYADIPPEVEPHEHFRASKKMNTFKYHKARKR